MIEIKPKINHQSNCPYCKNLLNPKNILWQGMHICVESICTECNTEIIEDLKVGHAVNYPYQVDLLKGKVFGNKTTEDWLGKPLLQSLQNPQHEKLEISKEVFKPCKRVIILNCIDYLYGHCLLKLLNAQKYLKCNSNYGLVVIVQKFLRWMVPEGVAEVWTVNIPLRMGSTYYFNFNHFIYEEFNRFDEIYISKGHSHPINFEITKFTKTQKHTFEEKEFRLTFIWREDRVWCNSFLRRSLTRLGLYNFAITIQNYQVKKLFENLRNRIPSAKFTVVGLGKTTNFPEWVEDLRVDRFDEKTESKFCQVYSESRLVIGVIGSNMLLPSGHAGMTIDLMLNGKDERWHNFAQDILYQESDPRLAAFRYRYVSFDTSVAELARMASSMILDYSEFNLLMTGDYENSSCILNFQPTRQD